MEPSRAWGCWSRQASALAGAVSPAATSRTLDFLTRLDAAAPRDRVVRSAVAVVAGLALCGVGTAARAGLPGARWPVRRRRGRGRHARLTEAENRGVAHPRNGYDRDFPTFASRQAKPTTLRRASEIVLVSGTSVAVMPPSDLVVGPLGISSLWRPR